MRRVRSVCSVMAVTYGRALGPATGVLALALAFASPPPAAANTDPYLETPHDIVPNFAQAATIRSRTSGDWMSASTWDLGRLPTMDDVVVIVTGHTVTIRTLQAAAKTVGIWAGARLQFDPHQNARLKVGTLLVMPDGALEAGTVAVPVDADKTVEIVIADQPLHTVRDGLEVFDPQQYGTGLLVWGQLTMHGAPRNLTFVRTAQEPKAGDSSLVLETAVTGWRSGDQLFLPDTRHLRWNETGEDYVPQWEELDLVSVTGGGTTLNLRQSLAFDHLGARDGDGRQDYLHPNGQEQDRFWFRPHVISRTRNVIVRSENAAGTRGHVFLTHRADVDVRYVRFQDLGRTKTFEPVDNTTFDDDGNVTHVGMNHMGRYSLHLHHLMGPASLPESQPQFTVLGNCIDSGSDSPIPKWAITVHDSHYGLVKDNVMYNASGAALMTEDGSESYNVIERNVAMRTSGWGGRGDRQDLGTEGSGFWLRGTNNYFRDNVAANIMAGAPPAGGSYGYSVFPFYLGEVNVPNFKGADTSIEDQVTVKDGNALGLLEFARNEVYGAMEAGMTYWWLGSFGDEPRPDALESVIKDLRVWHVFNMGIFHYPSSRVTVDGMVVRGNDPVGSACCSTGIVLGDYMANAFVLRNADIQGMGTGIFPSTNSGGGTQLIENSHLRNITNIVMVTLSTSSYRSDWIPRRTVIVRNVKLAAWPDVDHSNIAMSFTPEWSDWETMNVIQTDQLYVQNYNQVPGDDFQVFYNAQRPDYVVPQTVFSEFDETAPRLLGSPDAGLTNAQNWTRYGIAVAGAIAPCATSREEIDGIVCSAGPAP